MFKKRQLNALFKFITNSETGEALLGSVFGLKFYTGHSLYKAETYSEESHKAMVKNREQLADTLRAMADALDGNEPSKSLDE